MVTLGPAVLQYIQIKINVRFKIENIIPFNLSFGSIVQNLIVFRASLQKETIPDFCGNNFSEHLHLISSYEACRQDTEIPRWY